MKHAVTDDGRWVLGDRNAVCPKCRAPAAVHYAANGRAEFWHAPTDCCDWARARERQFSRDGVKDEAAQAVAELTDARVAAERAAW